MSIQDDNSNKVQKFNDQSWDDYSLWGLRVEIALKAKGLWSRLNNDECDQDAKNKAFIMLLCALGDTALRVC